MVAVVSQPMICSDSGSVKPAMIDRRLVRNIIVTITGTATTPFSTALQYSALYQVLLIRTDVPSRAGRLT